MFQTERPKAGLFLTTVFLGALISFSYFLSFSLRFEFKIPQPQWQLFLTTLPLLIGIRLVFAYYNGLSRGWMGHAGILDLLDILKYNVQSSLVFIMLLVLSGTTHNFLRSILVLDWTLNILCVGGARFCRRFIDETIKYFSRNKDTDNKNRVLIVGAGEAGMMIAREMRNNSRLNYYPVGYIDDNKRKNGQKPEGIPVLGDQHDLPGIVKQKMIDEIIISIPSATGPQLREIVNNCKKTGLKVSTTPSISSLINETVHLYQLREVAIEDLLGRKSVSFDHSGKEELENKSILVTGAGGSIGSELVWQIAQLGCKRLILFERGEGELYNIQLRLKKMSLDNQIVPVIGDVLNKNRLHEVFNKYKPDLVYHAAAYKHVPMMEFNPFEAVRNNIIGSINVARISVEHEVGKFIFVSSDKAVNPSSVMGATKRAVELALKALNASSTKFIAVRFGNVLNSRGSVVPLFKSQIADGGPVTVTHPFIIRYFMSIPEACQLILQAGEIGKGGELFLLDMGEPVRIVDLAENLIRLAGLRPYKDIDIVFTGLRPGEKLYEELFYPWEELLTTAHKKIMRVNTESIHPCFMNALIAELEGLIQEGRQNEVIACLKRIVPSFRDSYQYNGNCMQNHIEKDLDLNIKLCGREFKGKIAEIYKDRSIVIALPPATEQDMNNISGKLEATFYSSSQNKVVRFYSSIIGGQNGSRPPMLTVKYPTYFEGRDNIRCNPNNAG